MTAALITHHVRLAESGWRVVERSAGDDGRGTLTSRGRYRATEVALIECVECGAWEYRTWKSLTAARDRIRPCRHPMVDGARPYEDDPACQALVQATGGMTLEQIGAAMKLTRERVRQIETIVLDKLAKPYIEAGYDRETALEHLRHVLATRPEETQRSTPPEKLAEYRARYAAKKRKAGAK